MNRLFLPVSIPAMTVVLGLLIALPSRAEDLAAEKAVTKERMLQVYQAIQEYRKEHKELPASLGDLHPKYVSDLKTFLSPTGERTGHKIPFEALVDPKIATHFGYEFCDRPMGSIWDGKNMRMREFKQLQMLLVGGQVPMLRCFVYGDTNVFNVTYDGTFLETPVTWEVAWDDRLPAGALGPDSLLSRVASLLPENTGEAELAWIRLRGKVSPNLVYEIANRGNAQEEAATKAMELAGLIDAYLEKFPGSRQWGEAAQIQRQLLTAASGLQAKDAGSAWEKAVSRARSHTTLNEKDRYQLDMDALQFTAMTDFRTGNQAAAMKKVAEGLRQIIRDHPDQEEPYEQLLMLADDVGASEAEIAREIVDNPKAPAGAKDRAKSSLDREKILASPLELEFTALDGREVAFKGLRGKVVLVDFWATWCGPCVAEIPNVLEVYRKYHDQGFEIVGLSFDSDRSALEKFVAKREMPWPQFFDGQGWNNRFGKMFGIRGIPTMWLVDHTGRVIDRAARGEELGKKVERLLAARPKV